MGLFGGGLSKAAKAYNNNIMNYNNWLMDKNKEVIGDASSYVNLSPESDISYDTASGQYLNANPYIDSVANNVSQQIIDKYNTSYIPSALSSYAGSGRFGSGLFQKTLADTQSQMNQDVANAMNNLYYQNYNTERNYQEQARNRISSQYDPLNRYSSYSGIVNAYSPGQPIATTSNGSKLGSILQGAVSGAIQGGSVGGPWGALGGGLLGGTMGAVA